MLAPLVTQGDLDAFRGRTTPSGQADLVLAGASGVVRSHCGWDITAESAATFLLNGSGSRVLSLRTLNLTAVASVTVDGELLDVDAYRWSRRGQLYRAKPWSRWEHVEVVGDHGYVDIPDVVKIVTLGLAARYISNPEGLKSAAVGSVQRTWGDGDLSAIDLALLDEFRLP